MDKNLEIGHYARLAPRTWYLVPSCYESKGPCEKTLCAVEKQCQAREKTLTVEEINKLGSGEGELINDCCGLPESQCTCRKG